MALTKKQRRWLMIHYDEAARRSFADRTMAGDPLFNIEVEAGRQSAGILLDAESAYNDSLVHWLTFYSMLSDVIAVA